MIGDGKYSELNWLANTKVLLVEGGGCENDHKGGEEGKDCLCQQEVVVEWVSFFAIGEDG